jgi:lipoprotein-anchoring transpeptidase ErfK/SrfK
MKHLTAVACVLAASLVPMSSAYPQAPNLSRDAVNAAAFSEPSGKEINPVILRAQIILDRMRFSPGVIDGHDGDNLRKAVAAYEETQGLSADGKLDQELWTKLTEASAKPVLVEYTITEDDVKGPFTTIPDKFEEQADLERLSYASSEELLAERFHMDRDLLKALNPDKAFDRPGTVIVVTNVQPEANPGGQDLKAERLEVDKKAGLLRALAKDGALLAVYPASIGSDEKPAPSGSHKVKGVAKNPVYTYNPDYKFKGVKAKEAFRIKPGPNNPVGTTWIDLSVESFGIHGTPEPEKVGKVASHGCVRLTNWDIEELAAMVKPGIAVAFLD